MLVKGATGHRQPWHWLCHYSNVKMGAMASQITCVPIVFTTVCSGTDQRKHQSSASPAFVRGIHRWLVNSPHKGPVTWKIFHLMTSSFTGAGLLGGSLSRWRTSNLQKSNDIFNMQKVNSRTVAVFRESCWLYLMMLSDRQHLLCKSINSINT